MASIAIVTGSPGTGKSTVAARLAQAEPRGVHLPADLYFTFPAHPVSPYRPAAQEQNTAIMVALARTATAFASRGYDVFMEGILGPWFLPVLAREMLPWVASVDYVVLRSRLDTALDRVRAREGDARIHVVRQMHGAFAELEPYAGHAVDTDHLTPEQVVETVRRGQHAGLFTLDLETVATKGSVPAAAGRKAPRRPCDAHPQSTESAFMGFGRTTPVLRIFDEAKAREFYVDFLGFRVDWEHRFEDGLPLYMQVSKDACVLHLSEHHGDGTPGAAVRIETDELDAYQQRLLAAGYRYARPGIEAKPWGTREMTVGDPFGNRLTFTTAIST